jgi:hypothetical protein
MSVGSFAGCSEIERTCPVGRGAWVRLQVSGASPKRRGAGYNWVWDTTEYRIQLGYEPQLAMATTGYGLQLDMGFNWIRDTFGYAWATTGWATTGYGLQLGMANNWVWATTG